MEGGSAETALSAAFANHLTRLRDRCVWRAEVWMRCWTHAACERADRLRIDYVAELDGRLVGFEIKAPAESAADLGRQLVQCSQYAAGIIAANHADVPQGWIGKPLIGVFLRTTVGRADEFMRDHLRCAPRLYGAANVGFAVFENRGLCLRLCGERFWTEWRGYHQGMLDKTSRRGNGKFRPAGAVGE